MWPTFAFKTASILLGRLVHSFLRNVAGRLFQTSWRPSRNLHHVSLLPPYYCTTLQPCNIQTAFYYFKYWLISLEPLLPFFCSPVSMVSCIVESLGLVSMSEVWFFLPATTHWRPYHARPLLTVRRWVVPGSHCFLPVLSWWHCRTF